MKVKRKGRLKTQDIRQEVQDLRHETGKSGVSSLGSYIMLSLLTIGIAVGSALGDIDPASIVGLWLFDEVAGNRVIDSSGNGHDGEIKGATRVAGKYGKALEFGGDDYVLVPDAEDLRIGEQFTMQAWFFAKDIGNWRQIIAKSDEYLLRIDPPQEGNMMSAFVKAGNAWEPRASAFVPKLETWIHFAATYDSDQLRVYVDGALSGQSGRPERIQQTKNPVEFGRWGGFIMGDDIGYFVGIIDDVAIFNVALTEDEIRETMDGLQKYRLSVEASGKLAATWGEVKLMSSNFGKVEMVHCP